MSSNYRTTTSTFRQKNIEQNVSKPETRFSQNEVPIPEPRKQTPHNNHPLTITGHRANISNELDLDDQQVNMAKLVSIRHTPEPVYQRPNKRTSFTDTPSEFTTDEGVSSPINVDYEYEEEIGDEDYGEEEEYETSEQADELTNLSRQSMMPLHELIAYYQYIQRDQDQVQRKTASRQSSNASQQTTRAKNSIGEDVFDGGSLNSRDDETYGQNVGSTELKSDRRLNDDDEVFAEKLKVPEVTVENVDEEKGTLADNENQPQSHSVFKDKRRIRANVVLELINSERDFVKHLKDVVEGCLYPARRHPEIFTGERINTIFSNIEQLYEFQQKFLDSLESCINWDDLAESNVGQCFLDYEKGFSVYHYYCNNHPNAISELQDLYTKPRFVKFFEKCLELQNMIDISLDGFLLTPIQKICKYPLQLNELLKNTDEDHPDFSIVESALESMKNCANLANERKRRIEALADIMSFQEKVENWFGPKLSDSSSILIHSGEVSKMTSHTWSQGVQLYLFDHLLLYSKRDLLKRNTLILKGRICMDTVTEISDADEYKPKKSFKLYCGEQQKWFIFTTRSEKERDEWIKAFERERSLVESDENEGFHITEREIGVAKRALQNRKHSRSARYRHKRPDTAIVDQLDLDDPNTIMNRTLSLPSCIHPSHVMNFVEDSRVITNRKKCPSPTSSPKLIANNSQQMIDQENQQSSVGWFKKMGSKKLSKSQVYNVNGSGSPSSNKQQVATTGTSSTIEQPTATTNYDQLEKRYRDHMISEEQARLFRLNNDLPPPIFATNNPIAQQLNRPSPQPPNHRVQSTRIHSPESYPSTNLQSLTLESPKPCQDHHDKQQLDSRGKQESTFETTVVLSSGRVVRVREDAV